ncbi:hypothetical protein [Halorarum halobium]|uniref:hypothetical protein n=1 Tax=Halorarum halobium TaxID=3075121 RepID=UPI0028ACD5D3|nr:hypothetical protein [Halobaculum sp. XH14]
MSKPPARVEASDSPGEWRHHLLALAIVVLAFGVAAAVGSEVAYYAAALVAFSVWMGWFVMTAVEWLRHAEF